MTAKLLFLAVLLTVPGVQPAAADPHPRCFSVSEMNGWRSPDGKTIYLRTGADRYYRLDLARECSTLKSINPHLLLTNRGGSLICSALDVDVKASESPGGIVEPCFPKTLSELSGAEAAALPKDAKP
jgi:hypothetical protein